MHFSEIMLNHHNHAATLRLEGLEGVPSEYSSGTAPPLASLAPVHKELIR